MKTSSWRDQELLSAYLDGQLSPRQKARLEARLEQDAVLRRALADLQQVRALLRRMPSRCVPRAFTLTADMIGVRPPLSRPALALRWAAVIALILFFGSLVIPYPLPSSLMAGVPKTLATALMLEVATSVPQEEVGIAAAPMNEPLASPTLLADEPEQGPSLRAFSPSPSAEPSKGMQPSALEDGLQERPRVPDKPVVSLQPFQRILLALAIVLAGLALFLDRWRARSFRRRIAEKPSRWQE